MLRRTEPLAFIVLFYNVLINDRCHANTGTSLSGENESVIVHHWLFLDV